MAPTPDPASGPRKRRRFLMAFVALACLAFVFVLVLPRLLSTTSARYWLVGRINARLAPGSVAVGSLSLSWLGPIEVDGIRLADPRGKQVLAVRQVRLDGGILRLLASRPDYGKITVVGAEVDVERRVDGTIDLLDALASALRPSDPARPEAPGGDPNTAALVVLEGCSLRAVSPELAEPLVAGQLDGTIKVVPAKPLEIDALLADGERSLKLHALVDHRAPAGSRGDMALGIHGKNWPLHFRGRGALGRGRLIGNLDAARTRGLWSARSDSALVGFEADGPALRGDRLVLDRVNLGCDVAQTAAGWDVRRLELTSPVAKLRAVGAYPTPEGSPGQLRGQVDLAALGRMLPHALRLRDGLTIERGTATVRVDLATRAGSERADLVATIADLAARENGRDVVVRDTPTLTASVTRTGSRIAVEKAELKAAGVDITGVGNLDAGVVIKGTVDLSEFRAQLGEVLDLAGFDLAGHVRLAADYRRKEGIFHGRLIADGRDLDIKGVAAAPIRRDLARLDASVSGPSAADGLPTDWTAARFDLKADDVQVDVAANAAAGAVAVAALVAADVASPIPGRAEARVALRWNGGRAFDLERFRVGLAAVDASCSVALAVRGRVDLDAGLATLAGFPNANPGAIGLGPEGLTVTGLGRPGAPIGVAGGLAGDLAALDRLAAAWSGSTPKGLAGAWAANLAGSRSAAGRLDVDAKLNLTDFGGQPAALVARGSYRPDLDRIDLATLDLDVAQGRVVVEGGVAEVHGRRLAGIKGTIAPRWDVIGPLVAKSIGPDARFQATFRPFRFGGPLAGESTPAILAQLSGEVGLDLASAEAKGVVIGPAAVMLHFGGGFARFDPIATTVNGGPALIQGDLALDDAGGVWLRLNASRVDGAAINDAVSDALLAYVAPILARATEVNGKVSVAIPDRGAALPITAKGPARLDGSIVFQDVRFRPGPLAAQVFGLTGQPAPSLTISEPLQLQVADGRVRQSGLSIPLPGGSKLAFDGSVGFDRTLDARASIPLTAGMIGRDPTVGKLVAGTNVTVPIGGTLAKPVVDRQAFRVALREAARGMVGRGLQAEVGGLLDRVTGPTPGGDKPGKPGRDTVRGLLEGLEREVVPKQP